MRRAHTFIMVKRAHRLNGLRSLKGVALKRPDLVKAA